MSIRQFIAVAADWPTWRECGNERCIPCAYPDRMLVAIGAPFNPAQPQSFDRAYKGSLECEPLPPGRGTLRTTLTITVRDRNVTAVLSIFDVDGLHEVPLAMAGGTVDAAGVLHLGHTVYTSDAEFRGNYTATLSATGGTLAGTQVWTRTSGGEVTRTCTGNVAEIK
jgi:hypothetical protein